MSAFAYIIFFVVALLAASIGAVGAYFYYRARHREAVSELEALDQDLAEREEELHRLQYQFTNSYPGGPSNVQTEAQAEMQKLREELEQKNNDYNILKQDFDLEIGILKQELDQLREEKTNVEHTRRHLARKDAELEERASDLHRKEENLTERSEHLEAEIAEQKKRLDDDLAARTRRTEDALAERDRQVRAREISLEEEREQFERERSALREKQAQLDEDLFELPVDKFTSRQEAILIKRLRQQIKLQRDELEHLQRLYHQSTAELNDLLGSETANDRDTTGERPPADSGGGDDLRSAASSGAETPTFAQDEGDSFPAYSTLSSYVDRGGASAARTEPYDIDAPTSSTGSERHDDLTSLPGIDSHLQRTLNQLGITSFDQIARWSSADVRRVSERLGIDRKMIQDHWIINAQSHLFSRKAD